jgi:hypothetical protein
MLLITLAAGCSCSSDDPDDAPATGSTTDTESTVPTPPSTSSDPVDFDGDGHPSDADCNDFDDTRFPGADEVPYDGVDQAGDGDDLVAVDGDAVPGIAHGEWSPAADTSWPAGVSTELVDCLDDDSIAGVDPSTVFPGADDAPYDGIDSDCAADNDFDADADGFNVSADEWPTVEADYAAYVADWGYADREADWAALSPVRGAMVPGSDDCDDEDPSSYPGATEIVGDGRDQDCDGSADPPPFQFALEGDDDLVWHRPGLPKVAPLGDKAVVVLTAEGWSEPGGVLEDEVGLALYGTPAEIDPALQGAYKWRLANDTLPLAPTVDLATRTDCGEELYVGVAYQVTTSATVYSGVYRLIASGDDVVHNFSTVAPGEYDTLANDVHVVLDDQCQPWTLSCAATPEPALVATYGLDPLPDLATVQTDGLEADTCYPLGPVGLGAPLEAAACGPDGSCAQLRLSPSGGSPTLQIDGAASVQGVARGGYHGSLDGQHWAVVEVPRSADRVTLTHDGVSTVLHAGESVIAADAVATVDQAIVATLVDDPIAPVRVSFVDTAVDELAVPVDLPTTSAGATLTGVGLGVVDDLLVVTVTAHHPDSTELAPLDAVGWAFLRLAP